METRRQAALRRDVPARVALSRTRSRRSGAGAGRRLVRRQRAPRSEEHTSELQSLMRISYAVFCLKKKTPKIIHTLTQLQHTTNSRKTTDTIDAQNRATNN